MSPQPRVQPLPEPLSANWRHRGLIKAGALSHLWITDVLGNGPHSLGPDAEASVTGHGVHLAILKGHLPVLRRTRRLRQRGEQQRAGPAGQLLQSVRRPLVRFRTASPDDRRGREDSFHSDAPAAQPDTAPAGGCSTPVRRTVAASTGPSWTPNLAEVRPWGPDPAPRVAAAQFCRATRAVRRPLRIAWSSTSSSSSAAPAGRPPRRTCRSGRRTGCSDSRDGRYARRHERCSRPPLHRRSRDHDDHRQHRPGAEISSPATRSRRPR